MPAAFGAFFLVFSFWFSTQALPAHYYFTPFPAKAKQAILYDVRSGMVLLEKNADQLMTPSSMTKALFVYLVFQKLANSTLSLKDTFTVSHRARHMSGSRMFLEQRSSMTVNQLLQGIIVDSGNDATVTLEEGLFPSQEDAKMAMNQAAQTLGMTQSRFLNTTGWPDPGHVSTARDILQIGLATLRDFPRLYSQYYSQTHLTHNKITQYNRNPLVHRKIGDGIKTGFTDKGGQGLLGSGTQKGRRLVFVVNGLKSEQDRARDAIGLLKWGWKTFATTCLFEKGVPVGEISVENARETKVSVVAPQDIYVAYPHGFQNKVTYTIQPHPFALPSPAGTVAAMLVISSPGLPKAYKPLVLKAPLLQAAWYQKVWRKSFDFIASLFKGKDA